MDAHAQLVPEIPLDQIDESPTNPRKYYDQAALQELADDVRARGVLQPVLVRPKGPRFELIVGTRRLRASKLADRPTLPCLIREMSDQEVLETQIVENAQRADITPLEEAEAYQRLLKEHHLNVDEIAAKVQKSRSAVYGRLKLTELGAEGRKLLEQGRLTASTALLVARIPSAKLQREAAREVAATAYRGPMPHAEAQRRIHERYMLRLSQASWDAADADLLPGAGACAACPKRTGNQRELFADVKSADVCTDPSCFEKKRGAAGARRLAEAKREGRAILPAAEAKKVFSGYNGGLGHSAPYCRLEDRCSQDPKYRTYKQLLGKDADAIVVLATSPKGETVELLPKKGLATILRERGHDFRRKKTATRSGADDRWAKKVRFEKLLEDRIAGAVQRASDALHPKDLRLWKILAQGFVDCSWHDTLKTVAAMKEVTGWQQKKHGDAEAKLTQFIDEAKQIPLLIALCFDLATGREGLSSRRTDGASALSRACEALGIDPQQIAGDLAADLKTLAAAEKLKARAKKTPSKKKPRTKKAPQKKTPTKSRSRRKASRKKAPRRKSQPGVCRECGCTDDYGCPEGCSWVEPDLCSACA